MEKTKKGDFVEIEFVGKVKNTDTIFDTNIKGEAKKINLKLEEKPLIICIGEEMLVQGFDKALEEKEIGKKYSVLLQPTEAFGERKRELVKTIPLNIFHEKNIDPQPGMMLTLDNFLAKIISVSGGRVLTDLNNPLSGKEIEYEFKIKEKVSDEKKKVNGLQDFFFRQRFKFEIKDKNIVFEEKAEPFLKIFGDKFKELLGEDLITEKKQEVKKEKERLKEEKPKLKEEGKK